MTPEPKSTTATSSATKAAAKPKPQAQADRPAVASPLEVALSCLEKPKTVSKSAAVMEVDTHCEAPNRYTNYQVAVLTSAYEMTVKPTRAQHKALAKALDLTEKQSKIWFQNKRQRQRNALEMSTHMGIREEIAEMLETLQKAQYKSHILEIENQGLNSDLKRKAAQLEELEALTMVLQSGLLGPAGDLAQEGREFKRPKRIQEIQSCVAAQ